MSNITAVEALAGTIEYFAKTQFPNEAAPNAIAKFIETEDGRELYADHVTAMRGEQAVGKAQTSLSRQALDHFASVIAKNENIGIHAAMLKALDTELGRRLYQLAHAA